MVCLSEVCWVHKQQKIKFKISTTCVGGLGWWGFRRCGVSATTTRTFLIVFPPAVDKMGLLRTNLFTGR